MREIQFNNKSNKLVTFASRWRRELLPESVAEGKKLSKFISENNKREAGPAKNYLKEQINAATDRKRVQSSNERKYFEIDKSTPKTSSLNERKSSLGSLKRKKQLRQGLKTAKQFAGKNKVLLGLAGAGALGVAGTKLIRKMRSDKGKKRGGYLSGR
jgi:hypothetical protein